MHFPETNKTNFFWAYFLTQGCQNDVRDIERKLETGVKSFFLTIAAKEQRKAEDPVLHEIFRIYINSYLYCATGVFLNNFLRDLMQDIRVLTLDQHLVAEAPSDFSQW